MIPIDSVEKGKGRGDGRRWSPAGSSGRGEDENKGWVLESKGGSQKRGEQGLGGGVRGGGVVPI